ncbi:P-selectin glycoprotein ligand 1 [Rhinoderma darwinii]|uniref:P-selectin glycoprotein ligand 1 n=1 Tax=Rhinoderma darwinii TaxID=43563 RepID=UPI003F666D18
MSFPSTTLLLCLWLSPAIAYKLPFLDRTFLTDDDNTIEKPYISPFGFNYKWEWQSQDGMDEGTPMFARLKREMIYKETNKKVEKVLSKVQTTESPLKDHSGTTPYILKASIAAPTKAKSMPLLDEDETTPLTDLEQTTKDAGQKLDEDETTVLTDLEHLTERAGQKLVEDETTVLTDLEHTTKGTGQKLNEDETTHVGKSKQSETLVTELTLNPTTSEKLSTLTNNKYNKATTVKQVNSTDSQDKSRQQTSTNEKLLDDVTSNLSPKEPEASPTIMPVIPHDLTTERDVATVWFSASSGSSAKPAAVTHVTTSSEEKIHTQSIMRQCMLTILILAVVCTIFIIATIALAAKLSTMKQKNKLRHPATYTEMRCISSLLPDSDQQNKPKSKRLKTFATNMEESDGDNATLNSFLPDH